jgi:hypothetical protein
VCNPSHGAVGIWVSCIPALLLVEDLDCETYKLLQVEICTFKKI